MAAKSPKYYVQRILLLVQLFGAWCLPLDLQSQISELGNNFEHLTVDDGLSHATVNSILEDHLGMLWLGTNYGLNRFDGYEFKTFLPNPSSERAILGYEVLSLWEDSNGNIWVGHRNAGISILERKDGRFRRFPSEVDPNIDWENISVKKISADLSGNIWIATLGGGAIVFDANGKRLTQFCSYCEEENRRLSNDFVFDFAIDEEGRVWIGAAGPGLNVYDPATDELKIINAPVGSTMDGFGKTLAFGADNQLWVGTAENGLFRVDCGQLQIYPVKQELLSSPIITDLEWQASGELWIASDGGGVAKYIPSTNNWAFYQYSAALPGSLNTNAIYDLHFDRQDNLWIGTFNGGINVRYTHLSPYSSNRRYAMERSLGLRSVLSIAANDPTEVFLGTDGGGLFRLYLRPEGVELGTVPQPPEMQVITSILPEEERLWLGSFARGLMYYDLDKGLIKTYRNNPSDSRSLANDNVWDIVKEPNGNLWVGTLGGGLDLMAAGTNEFRHFRPEQGEAGISSVQVVDLLLDTARQTLWVATEDAGLNAVNLKTLEIRKYRHDPNKPNTIASDHLLCLFLDQEGILWAGTTYAGLTAIDPLSQQCTNYGPADGLSAKRINSVVEGPNGCLWLSTAEGIGRWDRSRSSYQLIGTDPYLENNQFNPRAALKTPDDRLLFGSANGYSLVLPNQVNTDTSLLRVWFAEASLSNESLSIGLHDGRTIINSHLNDSATVVQLRYTDKGISFRFAVNDFAQAQEVRYAYRLLGLDSTWQLVPPEQRFANYAALSGGSYELQVRASDRNGYWSPHIRKLPIEVTPPFWETWWFALLVTSAGIVLAIVIVKTLLRRQQAQFERQTIEAEQKLLRLQNEHLEKDVANKLAQLNASVLQIAHKNEMLNALKAQLESIPAQGTTQKDQTARRLLREIERELMQEDYWQQFQLTFNQSYQGFIKQIEIAHPNLSANDYRVCCFIKMRLRNKEIASILNVTVNGVEQAKYRLKKKIGLGRSENLNSYIQTLGQG